MRVLLFVLLLFWSLGADSELKSCFDKNSQAIDGKTKAIAVSADQLLYMLGDLKTSFVPADQKLIRYDELTGMALVEARHDLLPISFRSANRIYEHKNLALIRKNSSQTVSLASRQNALCPAKLDKITQYGDIVCAPCYAVVGVGFLGGFIESDLLQYFIASDQEQFFWGDLGVRFEDRVVSYTDPFADQPLIRGDEVLEIDGVKFQNSKEIDRFVLMQKPDQVVKIKIKRAGKIETIEAKIHKKLGGGIYADSLLERYGIRLRNDLFVAKILESQASKIQVDDRLIEINKQQVKTAEDVKKILNSSYEKLTLLFDREGFQFFININLARD